MKTFWITFENGAKASCDGESEYDSKMIAEKLSGKKVSVIKPLPYPAKPSIWIYKHPIHGECPQFCYKPNECCGKTACPQNYSCTE